MAANKSKTRVGSTQLAKSAASDVVWEAAGFAEVFNVDVRRAYYMLESGALKAAGARRVAGRWMASRAKLEAFIRGELTD